MSYETKYLKYKMKYLALKNQIAGAAYNVLHQGKIVYVDTSRNTGIYNKLAPQAMQCHGRRPIHTECQTPCKVVPADEDGNPKCILEVNMDTSLFG